MGGGGGGDIKISLTNISIFISISSYCSYERPHSLFSVWKNRANQPCSYTAEVLAMDGWMDDLRFYGPFISISVISGRWTGDNKRLCATEPRLLLK